MNKTSRSLSFFFKALNKLSIATKFLKHYFYGNWAI